MAGNYKLPRTKSGQRIPMRDIAEAAEVSISTVSRVLNHNEGISQSVRQRVLTIAESFGYQATADDTDFISTRRGPENEPQLTRVHLFVNAMRTNDSFHADVMAGIEEECRLHNLQVSYTVTPPYEEDYNLIMEKVAQLQNDGLIFISQDDPRILKDVAKLNYRIVSVNAEHYRLPIDSLVHDNWSGVIEAMRYLIDRGHRSILHITGNDQKRSTIFRRNQAYQAALEQAGIPFNPTLLACVPSLDLEGVYQWIKNLLNEQEPYFTAIFCANDTSAIGAMRALQEAGLRIPQDISIIGYGDIPMAAFTAPPLTSVHIERGELGKLAVRRLLERVKEPHLSPVRTELYAHFVERQSVAPITQPTG